MRFLVLVVAACSASTPHPPAPIANAQVAVPEAGIGTVDPVELVTMARDGHWLVICQAREDTDGVPGIAVDVGLDDVSGDTPHPYLIWGVGLGEPIDTFLAASPDGRWLAVVRHGVAEVIDTITRRAFALPGIDLFDDESESGPARAVAFGSHQVAYLRGTGGHDEIVIRDLDSGEERTPLFVPGLVWKLTVDDGGRWAQVHVIRDDSDGNGTIAWPRKSGFPFERVTWRCLPWRGNHVDSNDTESLVWLDLATGTVVDDRNVITPVGASLLVRDDATDGIELGGRRLARDCRYGVHAITHDPPRILAGCGFGAQGHDAPLAIYDARGHAQLTSLVFHAPMHSFHSSAYSSAQPSAITSRFECIDERCVELATGREFTVDGDLTYRFDDYAVVARREDPHGGYRARWFVVELATGRERELPGAANRAVQQEEHGPILDISDAIGGDDPITPYDIRTAKPVPLAPGTKIFGNDLVHRRYVVGVDNHDDFARGPLRWQPVD